MTIKKELERLHNKSLKKNYITFGEFKRFEQLIRKEALEEVQEIMNKVDFQELTEINGQVSADTMFNWLHYQIEKLNNAKADGVEK